MIEPFPTPALIGPVADTARTLLNVPLELLVVFPDAERLIVEKLVTDGVVAETVSVPADAPTDTIPAPEILKLFPTVNVVDAAPSVFPAIVAVMVE